MIAIVTPDQMAAVDAAALEPVEELIERAGRAVARVAIDMMGGTYGRRVVVVAGPGNNGADGRVAARHLQRRGVRCVVFAPGSAPEMLPPVDLVVDAAFGTGLRRPFSFPSLEPGTSVLAVDIPSGVDGLTGEASGSPAPADVTITFAALKPGLLIEPGRSFAGKIEVADIGLDVGEARSHLVDRAAVASWIPAVRPDGHKWTAATRIIAGSRGMTGAAHLSARAALRTGSGYVQLGTPGLDDDPTAPTEAVGLRLPPLEWGPQALDGINRFGSLLVGPGIETGLCENLGDELADNLGSRLGGAETAASASIPIVFDGGALTPRMLSVLTDRTGPTVITPHDGEWKRIGGSLESDRIAATRDFSATHRVVVLRKGPSTVVAEPDGRVLVVANGPRHLATAGTGDVLAGMTAALLARGVEAFQAAAAAAFIHGEAARSAGPGMIAGDLIDLIPAAIPTRETRP